MKNYRGFVEWIDHKGVPWVAARLGCTTVNVRQWRLGYCWPRPKQMKLIKKLSGGAITYDMIIDGVEQVKPPHLLRRQAMAKRTTATR